LSVLRCFYCVFIYIYLFWYDFSQSLRHFRCYT
jgi:hypothetical protein